MNLDGTPGKLTGKESICPQQRIDIEGNTVKKYIKILNKYRRRERKKHNIINFV